MHDKIDKFLAYVKKKGDEKVVTERVAVKPTKVKAVVGFAISLLFFISCLFLLLGTVWGYILTILSFVIMVYYGTNVFTKKGLGIYQHVQVESEEDEEKEQVDPIDEFYNQNDEEESEEDAQDRD